MTLYYTGQRHSTAAAAAAEVAMMNEPLLETAGVTSPQTRKNVLLLRDFWSPLQLFGLGPAPAFKVYSLLFIHSYILHKIIRS